MVAMTILETVESIYTYMFVTGNGLGVAGTRDMRDLPVLWATPSPSGFMMTCPSVLGPGR